MKTLEQLIQTLNCVKETRGNMRCEIDSITCNSREASQNGLFFCIPGTRVDGHDFAEEACRNGCVALIVERFLDVDVPQIKVTSVRRAEAAIAAAFYDFPARSLRLVGVTGTKGKTTVTYMVKAICEQAGYKCGLIGTTGNMIGPAKVKSDLTTPDPIVLQKTLRKMADEGVEIVSMEISAHAIDMHRLDGLTFEVGCYTNLSQDHLDYFHTMENYFETKKKFFTQGLVENAAINADDETSADILKDLTIPHVTFGICVPADLFARDIEITENGVNFNIQLQNIHTLPVNLKMTGMFNVYNALAAVSCAMILGISTDDIVTGLQNMAMVPGRIEMLDTHTPYKVILDYSHSPDALENILRTVRQFAKNKVVVLFGCGGDRDHGKRPVMGKIAGLLADFSIITSDNPRSEDPMAIISSIEEGIRETKKPYIVIENRREAIQYALEHGNEGDVIVLAGKGHETYQEINGVKRPFDEKQIVQEILADMSNK